MRAGGAGGGGGGIRSFCASADRDITGSQVDDGGRNKERGNTARPMRQKIVVFPLDDFKAADTAADVDADALLIFRVT